MVTPHKTWGNSMLSAYCLGVISGGFAVVLVLTILLANIPIPSVTKAFRYVITAPAAGYGSLAIATYFGDMPIQEATLAYLVPSLVVSAIALIFGFVRLNEKATWNGLLRIRIVIATLVLLLSLIIFAAETFSYSFWYRMGAYGGEYGQYRTFLWWGAILIIPSLLWWLISGALGWIKRGFSQ